MHKALMQRKYSNQSGQSSQNGTPGAKEDRRFASTKALRQKSAVKKQEERSEVSEFATEMKRNRTQEKQLKK